MRFMKSAMAIAGLCAVTLAMTAVASRRKKSRRHR